MSSLNFASRYFSHLVVIVVVVVVVVVMLLVVFHETLKVSLLCRA